MKQAFRELYSQKRRLLIALAILLVCNIALYIANDAYFAPKIISSQASWNDLRQRVAVAGRDDVTSVYQRGIDDLKKLSARIPLKRQFPRVLGDILDSAVSSGVVTGTVSYKPNTVKGHELLDYTVSMTVNGSYAAVKSFLGDLQKNSDLIVVDGITLSNSDLFEENVTMEIHLSIYLQSREGA
ncbi:MAG: type 4a pilus biogenesis protein PilO [Geobacteraceae bacterium]|nr:type 4a pilus biogenesis protein PilO [Geobacteraceae bacterium]